MFTLDASAWQIVLRAGAVYLALLAGLRITGKREIGQMTIFDLVVLLLLANAVQNAMVGDDTTLAGGLIAAATLLALNTGVSRLSLRWPHLRRLIEGSPTVLVLHGQVIAAHLRREGVDEDELGAALREHGVASLEEVEMAVLEIDGSISVVPTGQPMTRVKHPRKSLRHQ